MAIDLTVNENFAVPLSVDEEKGTDFQHSEAYIYAISPSAKVEESEDGATITIKDKDGETVVVLHNGKDGKDGADGAQGLKGDKGDTGEQGPPGSDADAIRFLPVDSASGAVASFTDGADNVPLKSLVAGINPVQSGEGDPSPENIRPISGWAGITVNANGTEIPISWESEAGTVYGGTLDVTNGVLTVDRVKETFVFNNPTEDGTYNLESQRFNLAKRSTGASNSTGKITNVCGAYAYAQANWHNGEPHFYVGTTSWTLYLTKNAYRGGSVELCYPLGTPLTYQLTPTEVKSLLGSNTIYADTGDTTVEYRADIQKWVEKKLSTRSTVSLTRSMPVQTEEADTELLQ